jgi:predicted molibdopterin-dependent oxidoreductase YjgC
MSTVPTTCPFCACGCGLYLLANETELVGVAPSETHPISLGRLCARGWAAHEASVWGKRLRQPLIRRNGKAEPVGWAEALDCAAGRIRALLDAGKPVGVLGSPRATNEENFLAGKLARAALRTNHIDFCLHSSCRSVIAGLEQVTGEYAGSIGLADIESSETILLIEGDLAKTHPRAAFSVMRAVDKGARLITIGAAKTQMARLSSLYLQTAAGNEGEALNSLLAGVLHSGPQDRIWITVHCEGYDKLRQDVADARTTEATHRAAEWIARAARAAFLMAPAGGREDRPNHVAAAVATLAAISGHLDRPGSGLLLLLGRSNVRGACEMGVVPDRLPGYQPLHDSRSQQNLQDLWGCKLPIAPGMTAERMLESAGGLIVLAEDPPSVLPMGQQAAALEKLECLIVLDAFVTPTTRAAHVVLPIASFAETEGTQTSMEGRIQRLRAAANPPGEARAGWQVLAELCARFGAGVAYASAGHVFREIAQAVPRYATLDQQVFAQEWGGTLVGDDVGRKLMLRAAENAPLTSDERPYVLARDGMLDWSRDPLVSYAPTLARDCISQRKLYPQGLVEMSRQDADELGVRSGSQVKLNSAGGDAVVSVQIRQDLKPGVLLVPGEFSQCVANVLGSRSISAIRVERA